ncbi:MAG: hypothetical protein A2Z25_00790 [Planctomycetes bacterium RBG_16_55_9]|nr:MAG: hypothetical protein A2Z25_00790 [Planctomycetes bacterium RBG_16_55_9]
MQVISQSQSVPGRQPVSVRQPLVKPQLQSSRQATPARESASARQPAAPVRQPTPGQIGSAATAPEVAMASTAGGRGYYGVQVSQQLLDLAGF